MARGAARVAFVAGVLVLFLAPSALAASLPRVELRVHRGQPCPGYEDSGLPVGGCAEPDGDVYLLAGVGPFAYHHEVGHVVDYQLLGQAHRARFAALTGDRRAWWEGLDTLSPRTMLGYGPPAERLADAYAICALQATGRPWAGVTMEAAGRPVAVGPSEYGYELGYRRHRSVCRLIWNATGLRWDVQRPRRRLSSR